MRIFFYSLAIFVALCVIGFLLAAFFNAREFGIKLFQLGFFLGGFSAVLIILTSDSVQFGRLGSELKITGVGFGLIIFGLLLDALFGLDSLVKSFFFYGGMIVMIVAIVKSLLKLK